MIVMYYNVGVIWLDKFQEKRVINFVCYGEENGYFVMVKIVGFIIVIVIKMVLDGKFFVFEGKKIFFLKWIILFFDKLNFNDSDI